MLRERRMLICMLFREPDLDEMFLPIAVKLFFDGVGWGGGASGAGDGGSSRPERDEAAGKMAGGCEVNSCLDEDDEDVEYMEENKEDEYMEDDKDDDEVEFMDENKNDYDVEYVDDNKDDEYMDDNKDDEEVECKDENKDEGDFEYIDGHKDDDDDDTVSYDNGDDDVRCLRT